MKDIIANKITDFGLVFIAITAIPFNIITFYALEQSEFQIVRFIPPFLGLSIILLAFFKKSISLAFKVQFFITILLLAGFFSLLLGLLDTASLWFVLVIIYTLFTGERKTAFYLFVFSFISVLTIGILMVTSNPYIPFDYGFEDCQFACVAIRIIDFLIIGFLIFYIIKIFLDTINSYLDDLSEKTKILEELNTTLQQKIAFKNKTIALENELEIKNKKLAIRTLQLVRKTEFEVNFTKKLKGIAKDINLKNRAKLKRLIQTISVNNKSIIWNDFEKSFVEINTSFYDKLYKTCPQLSQNEKKISAFIKLNMSTKDMATLLNISSRGVETARYRLRKKMKLKSSVSLRKFLQEL